MNRQGTITKIEGPLVRVSLQPLSCCSGEGACSCMQAGKFVEFQALNSGKLDLRIGDYVDVHNSQGKILWQLTRMLLLPGLLSIVGAVLAAIWFRDPSGTSAALGGLVGAALGFLMNFSVIRFRPADYPVVQKVIREDSRPLRPFLPQ